MELSMIRSLAAFALLLSLIIPVPGQTAELRWPPFLPEYYAPAFELNDQKLFLMGAKETKDVEKFVYATEDRKYALIVERIQCDRPRCQSLLDNVQGYVAREIKGSDGVVFELARRELSSRIIENGIEKTLFAYILPGSIVFWTYAPAMKDAQMMTSFKTIKSFANKQRYEQSFEDNVAMGAWGAQIHEYARQLLQEGKRQEALPILRRLVATSPYNFGAHRDLNQIIDDAKGGQDR